ncbi:heme lyase CcmF/NrfE family subunit [Occallatibacter riparius]|uniref:Cytochrome c biogenesis protein CcsA n=1 Tax=Occallatibacter riparius TaxID=1002689 RepID=A0A9J7BRJ3_9BACT|nr:cytochrome c-type biogenesis CcmF C-terminal domain-containing protein [Occallatibacter riparius]UWZ83542.1 cytochrome c biogenesis protein CcsA [Occallatibacter riparius]
MATFGSFALIIALALAAYNLFAGAVSLRLLATGQAARVAPERLADTARRAGIAGFVAVTAAAFALVFAALTNDFSITYIMEHSNRALPWPYKFAALWSGQEGSLLLWAWLLGIYGFVLRLRHKTDVKLFAYAGTILAGIQLFFLAILNFAAPPFSVLKGGIPEDGNGLNPLLQYPEMVIHPPMLYLGYVGFAVPFAFGLGALMMRYPGEKWIKITRVWTLVSWLFLSCGIFLGMHWAYAVLGWGGYWGWDPVENASFMPWLTGTAFLHSVMMQEKRGMMKSWNVWLIFSTFMLTLLGTLLTRAGLVSSVHAFAQSSIGTWFYVFMVIVLAVCIFAYILQRSHLKTDNHLESLVSRESSFLFNNLVLLVACFVILWGTLFPILSEYVQGTKVTVGAPFYNAVAVPIGLFLLFLTGVGPLLPWRAASMRAIKKNFIVPVIALWATVIVCMVGGARPWDDTGFVQGKFYALVGFALSAAVMVAILSEFYRGARVIAKQTGKNLVAATYLLSRRNTRRYGGYLVHIGLVIIIVGLCGAAFNKNVEKEMGLHDKMEIGPYVLEGLGFSQDSNLNYDSEFATLDVQKGGKSVFQLSPEKRVYHASQQPQTMVAIHSNPFWDLYVVYEGVNPGTGQPIIKAFLNPLVGWIWGGFALLVFGTLFAIVPPLTPATAALKVPARAATAEPAVAGSAQGGRG